MKKIPTLFKREFEGHKIVRILPEPAPGLEWVLTDPGVIPTVKYDGSCCMIDQDGRLWKRYDAKSGRIPPKNALPCQEYPDPVTGHWPHWVPVGIGREDHWYNEALFNKLSGSDAFIPGTYEAIGPHFNGNPYHLNHDTLIMHGLYLIPDLPISFESIKRWFTWHYEEGIVFWYDGAPVAKIKRSDFGLPWGTVKGGFTHANHHERQVNETLADVEKLDKFFAMNGIPEDWDLTKHDSLEKGGL